MRKFRLFSSIVCMSLAAFAVAGCDSELLPEPSATVSDDATTGADGTLGDAGGTVNGAEDAATAGDSIGGTDAPGGDDAVTLTDAVPGDDAIAVPDAPVAVDAAPGTDATSATDAALLDVAMPDVHVAIDISAPADIVLPDAPAALCGNGYCDAGENPQNCASDCKGLSWTCGDGVCDIGEQFYCSNDCSASACGNGKCEPGEGVANCPGDCPATPAVCGNGQCESGENGQNCPKDCGIGTWNCGDGTCDFGEQFYCAQDCQTTQVDPVQCTQQKCTKDYTTCAKSADCLKAFSCILGCSGKWSCQQQCVQAAGNGGNDAVQTALCGQQAGCF